MKNLSKNYKNPQTVCLKQYGLKINDVKIERITRRLGSIHSQRETF